MGWCSGTQVFDDIMYIVLNPRDDEDTISKAKVVRAVIDALWEHDWDCEEESDWWKHPIVQTAARELDPRRFEDEDC